MSRKLGCEPNERWRTSARNSLGEIQQRAAVSAEETAWKLFNEAEVLLAESIEQAARPSDCEWVDQRIEELARRFDSVN